MKTSLASGQESILGVVLLKFNMGWDYTHYFVFYTDLYGCPSHINELWVFSGSKFAITSNDALKWFRISIWNLEIGMINDMTMVW